MADRRSGDKMALDALELMNSEGVSSLAVVDNQCNVMGNISTADVKVRCHSPDRPRSRTDRMSRSSTSQDPARSLC